MEDAGMERDGDEVAPEGIETVERAFLDVGEAIRLQREETAARIDALDRSLAAAAEALGELVRADAAELARLRRAVEGSGPRLDRLDMAVAELERWHPRLGGAVGRLEALAHRLDGLVERPLEAERQNRERWRFATGGGLAILLVTAIGFVIGAMLAR